MAYRLGPLGPDGECCECSGFYACKCGTFEAATLECRMRGGTASLCGFEEFTDVSSPPKKYRRLTPDGVLRFCYETGHGCVNHTLQAVVVTDWRSAADWVYDQLTCASTQPTGSQHVSFPPPALACGYLIPGNFSNTTPLIAKQTATSQVGRDVVRTSTTWETTGTGACVNNDGGPNDGHYTGSLSQTLSDEDTEADAIARLLAGGGGTWGAWSEVGETSCLAHWQTRTSGFNLQYQEAEYRLKKSGLDPLKEYAGRVQVYRRPYGVGAYELYQTVDLVATTDGSGDWETAAFAVPNDEGFQTYVTAPEILVT